VNRTKAPLGAKLAEAKVNSKQDKAALAMEASLPVPLTNAGHLVQPGDILYMNPQVRRMWEGFIHPLATQKWVPEYLMMSSDRNAFCLVHDPQIEQLRKTARGGDPEIWDTIRLG
jgi:hypothetical protein